MVSQTLSLLLPVSLYLPDPRFIAAHVVPDSDDRDDDKVYFFFTEKAMESGDREGAIHTRVGRVCAVRRRRGCNAQKVCCTLYCSGGKMIGG